MEPRTKYILGGLGLLAVAVAASKRSDAGGYDPFPDDSNFSSDLEARRIAARAAPRVRRYQEQFGRTGRQSGGPYGWQNAKESADALSDDLCAWTVKKSRPHINGRPPKGEEDITDNWNFDIKMSFHTTGVAGQYRIVSPGSPRAGGWRDEPVLDGWFEVKRTPPNEFEPCGDVAEGDDWVLQFRRAARGTWHTLRIGSADTMAREAFRFENGSDGYRMQMLRRGERMDWRRRLGYRNSGAHKGRQARGCGCDGS